LFNLLLVDVFVGAFVAACLYVYHRDHPEERAIFERRMAEKGWSTTRAYATVVVLWPVGVISTLIGWGK
jgi:hypothetical protein